jgi:hypothetical protein
MSGGVLTGACLFFGVVDLFLRAGNYNARFVDFRVVVPVLAPHALLGCLVEIFWQVARDAFVLFLIGCRLGTSTTITSINNKRFFTGTSILLQNNDHIFGAAHTLLFIHWEILIILWAFYTFYPCIKRHRIRALAFFTLFGKYFS